MIPVSEILAIFHRVSETDGTAFDAAQDLDPFLSDIKLYPHTPIVDLGGAVADILEKRPAAAIEVTLRLVGSPVDATRALACIVIGRLARHSPAPWMELSKHLASDESWEVREYAAYIFDTHGTFEGLAAFHLDYCFEILSSWIHDTDYRVRGVAANALLGFFSQQPDIGERLLQLLKPLLSDGSDYVRNHFAGALRTMGRKRPELVFSFVELHVSDEALTTADVLRLILNHRWTHGHDARRDEILKQLK